MSVRLKSFLDVVAKNAVNAVVTNAALMAMLSDVVNVTTAHGWWNIGKVTLGVIGGREFVIWLPVVLKWSSTNANPDDLQSKLETAQVETEKAVTQAGKAADAVADAKAAAPEVKS